MKICVISPGVVHAVPRTVAFSRYFEHVHFIDMTGTADRSVLESHGISYHLPAEGGQSRWVGVNLRRLLRRMTPDAIVCHYALGDHFFGAVAYGRCPVAVISMGTDILYDRGAIRVPWLRRLLVRMALRRVGFVSAKSAVLAERIRSYGARCPLEVNFWGTDLTYFCPGDRIAARKLLGLPADVPVVLSPRTLNPTYNIDRIVAAFRPLRDAFPAALLVLAGRSSPPYLERVRELVGQLKLGDSVRLPGEVDATTLRAYYRASDVVVSMASTEGFPNTLLEAMSCGAPIVAGRLPQLEELLIHGVSAELCDMDVPAIAASIEKVLEAPARAAAMAGEARRVAAECGDLAVNGASFAQSLQLALATPRRRSALSTGKFRAIYLASRLWERL